jgi:aspartyl-tRNA(Asn)/glutamyl-tRNA(Gln) amidotransferase subunit A
LARSAGDLAASYDAMQGYDAADPVCVDRPPEMVSGLLDRGINGVRIVCAGGYFRAGASPEALAAMDAVASAVGATDTVDITDAQRARSAAYVITTTEGAALHLERLRARPDDFDADVRDRLIAGALVPAAAVVQAQKFRRWFREKMLRLFQHIDAILAPATPCVAPFIGQKTFVLDGQEMPTRANIGLYTQPISFVGLPVVAVPAMTALGLPIGVQIITAPWREDLALRIARHLEMSGVVRAPVAALGD